MENNVVIVEINAVGQLTHFDDARIHLVKLHLSNTRTLQFEDNFGNLWYAEELKNITHLVKINF